MTVRTGLETLLADSPALVEGKRIALVTNYACVTSRYDYGIDALAERCRAIDVIAPEHGFWSGVQYMDALDRERWPHGNVAIHAAYDGQNSALLTPDPRLIADADLVLVDLQDVGARYYTYAATMVKVMGIASELQKRVIVLDRPNPIGGVAVEGNVNYHEPYISFVANLPVPNRHGMTIAELALYCNRRLGIGCSLDVIPMSGWHRDMLWNETGLPWVSPSPNIATPDTVLVYPGTCLFEGTNVSEGRGTTHPFELVGAPWLDEFALAERLNALALPGVHFRPQVFRPTASKFSPQQTWHEAQGEAQACHGVFIHVTDARAFRPVATGALLLKAIRDLDPERFQWRRTHYEFAHVMAIDTLMMTSVYQLLIERGSLDDVRAWLEQTFAADCAAFRREREEFLVASEYAAA